MRWTLLAPAILSAACFTLPANAEEFSARLTGFQEIGGLGAGETGAISIGWLFFDPVRKFVSTSVPTGTWPDTTIGSMAELLA